MPAAADPPPTSPAVLDHFALLAVEFVNLPALAEQYPDQQEALIQGWLHLLQLRVQEANATLERIHQHRAFFAFPYEPTAMDSLEAALTFAQQLAQRPLQLLDGQLVVKMGLALEARQERSPLTGVTERSLAEAGQVVLEQSLAGQMGLKRYPFQPVAHGPVGQYVHLALGTSASSAAVASAPAIASGEGAQAAAAEDPPPTPLAAHTPLPPGGPPSGPPPAPAVRSEEERQSLVDRFIDATLNHELTQRSQPGQQGASQARIAHHSPDDGFTQLNGQGFDEEAAVALLTDVAAEEHHMGTPQVASPQPVQTTSSQATNSQAPSSPVAATHPAPVAPAVTPPVIPLPTEPASAASMPPPPSRPEPSGPLPPLFEEGMPPLPQVPATQGFVPATAPLSSDPPTPFNQASTQLAQWLYQAMQAQPSYGQLIRVMGPSGMGKTMLAQVARMQIDPSLQPSPQPAEGETSPPPPAEPPLIWLSGQPQHHSQRSPFPLEGWYRVMLNFFNLPAEGVPLAFARQHIEGILQQVLGNAYAGETRAFWQTWLELVPVMDLSLSQPLDPMPHLFGLLQALGRIKPVVLVLDDIDRCDPATVQVLTRLLDSRLLQTVPISVVLLHQDTVAMDAPLRHLYEQLGGKTIRLAPLTPPDLVTFLEQTALAGQTGLLPQQFLQQVHHVSGGLPFVVEELLRYLVSAGALEPNPDTGGLRAGQPERLRQVQLPSQLADLLQHRAQLLSDEARQVLQVGSVLGRRFSPNTLLGLCQLEEESFHRLLQQLWEQGWLVPDAANDLTFRHDIQREFFYLGTPEASRQQLHQVILQSLQSGYTEPIFVSCGLLTHHALLAQLGESAIQLLQRTVQWCLALQLHDAAAHLLGSLLERLADDNAELKPYRLAVLEQLLAVAHQTSPELTLQTMRRLVAERLPNPSLDELRQLASLYEWTGQFAQAGHVLRHAEVHLLEQGGSLEDRLGLLLQWQDNALQRGRLGEVAQRLGAQVLPSLAEAERILPGEALDAYRLQGQLQQNLLTLEQDGQLDEHSLRVANQLASQQQDPHAQIVLQCLLTRACWMKGRLDTAHALLNQLLPLIEQQPQPAYYLAQWGLLAALCHLEQHDTDNALLVLPNTLVKAEESRDYGTALLARTLEGVAYLQRQHYKTAGDILGEALAKASQLELIAPALWCWRHLAELELRLKQPEPGLYIVEQALQVAEKPALAQTLQAHWLANTQARLLLENGQVAQAGRLLQGRWSRVSATGLMPLIAEYCLSIALLYLAMGQQPGATPQQEQRLQKSQTFYGRALQIWQRLGYKAHQQAAEVLYREAYLKGR